MTRPELIKSVAEHNGVTQREASVWIDGVMGVLTDLIANNDRVTIYEFGSFEHVVKQGKSYIHPRTGERKKYDPIHTVKFTPSQHVKSMLN